MDNIRSLALLSLSWCLVWVIGCGPGKPPAYPTTGRVHFPNGSPVRTGTIELKSREHQGIHARGAIESDGTFVLTTYRDRDGAVAGTHDCVVVQLILAEETGKTHGTFGVVHPRFGNYSTAKLECRIEPRDKNVIDLTVEGVGKLVQGGSEKDHK